jgi:hypothetical protein
MWPFKWFWNLTGLNLNSQTCIKPNGKNLLELLRLTAPVFLERYTSLLHTEESQTAAASVGGGREICVIRGEKIIRKFRNCGSDSYNYLLNTDTDWGISSCFNYKASLFAFFSKITYFTFVLKRLMITLMFFLQFEFYYTKSFHIHLKIK